MRGLLLFALALPLEIMCAKSFDTSYALLSGYSSLRVSVAADSFDEGLSLSVKSWPLSLLALDVDVIPQRSTAAGSNLLQNFYGGAPSQRVSLSLNADGGESSSDIAVAKFAACGILAWLLPVGALPIRGCAGGSNFDIDLSQAAAISPASLRRDGILEASALETKCSTASSSVAEIAAIEAKVGPTESLVRARQWGGGQLAAAAAAANATRVVTLTVALDTPPRGGWLTGTMVNFTANGPIGRLLVDVRASMDAALTLGGMHLSIVPEWDHSPAGPRVVALRLTYAEVAVRSAKDSESPVVIPLATATLSRQIDGTGLHRDLEYTIMAHVHAPFGVTGAGVGAGGSCALVPRCRLALVQRLEASTYIDLDEVREAVRRVARHGRTLGLRAFAPHIDVERPTSVSTQNVVVLWLPLDEGFESITSAKASPFWARARLSDSVDSLGGQVEGGNDTVVEIDASFSALVHFRYQTAGCDSASAGVADVAAAAAAPWTAIMSNIWGPLRADGSFYFDPADKIAVGTAGRPFVAGCYALAHLPQPTLHVSCDSESSGEEAGSIVDEKASGAVCSSAPATSALAAALASAGGGWHELPAGIAAGSSSLPGQRGFAAHLTPPLAPVPIGCSDHAAAVSFITTSVAVIAALLLARATLARARAPHAA